MLNRQKLLYLYIKKNKSAQEIASAFSVSRNKVIYWMEKYRIPRRSISSAVYLKNNPTGDPFKVIKVKTKNKSFIYGLGLGLFLGEGNKKSKNSVRLGNTDPKIIKNFILFLKTCFNVSKGDLKFGLQIFNDIDPAVAIKYWCKEIGIKSNQFYLPTISSNIRKTGTYKHKSQHGVLTVYFNNTNLKRIIDTIIEKL